LAALLASGRDGACPISDGIIKIGVLNDDQACMPTWRVRSVVAARMAVEDLARRQGHEGRDRLRRPPEKGRRRLGHRRQWYDVDKVD
jgi:hypothetical protein